MSLEMTLLKNSYLPTNSKKEPKGNNLIVLLAIPSGPYSCFQKLKDTDKEKKPFSLFTPFPRTSSEP